MHEGKLNEFGEVANQCITVSKEKDPGTLQYDWFFNPGQTECAIGETTRIFTIVVADDGRALNDMLPFFQRYLVFE